MQIVILHWAFVKLKSPSKSVNAPMIEKYTGVKKYRGNATQRKKIYSKINIQNFNDMLKRIDKMSRIDTEKNSTNFGSIVKKLHNDQTRWISKINNEIE